MVVLPLSSTSRGRSRLVQWFSGSALALCCLPSSPVTLRSWPLVKARCICRRWVCINQFANVPAAGSYAYIRRTSDRLRKDHGLSVVTSQLDELDVTMAQRSELGYLIYNDPLGYADLILNGNPEEYLKNVAGSHGLVD